MKWLSLITVPLCLFAQTVPPPKLGRVTVSVLNSVTKQPVGNARVTLRDSKSSRPPYTTTTGNDGRAEFTTLPVGEYSISEVRADNFMYDAPSPVRLTLTETAAAQVLVVPAGEIRGTVLDEDKKPALFAVVSAHRYAPNGIGDRMEWVQAGFTLADPQGGYRIANLAPGRYVVLAGTTDAMNTPQLEQSYYPSASDPARAIRLEVSPGGIVDKIDFRLRPATLFHVRGKVTGARKRPGTVLIESCTSTQSSLRGTAIVTEDGSFDAQGIPPGSYCANFIEPASERGTLSFATTPVVVIDRDVDDVNLIAAPPVEVTGTVVFAEGASFPMPASLFLLPHGPFPVPPAEGKVDAATGRFKWTGVLPFDNRIQFVRPPGSYIQSIRSGGQDFSDGIFNPTRASGDLTIRIAAARGRLTGRVTNGTDKPAAGLPVTVSEQSNRRDLLKTTRTDERGNFAVTGLAPGNYKVLAWEKIDTLWAQAPEFLNLFSGTVVKLADGEERNIEVRMIPAREVEEVKGRF